MTKADDERMAKKVRRSRKKIQQYVKAKDTQKVVDELTNIIDAMKKHLDIQD